MATIINPYLNFNGDTEKAFNFYKSVFGGEFSAIQRIKETPEAKNFPANEQDRLMHVALPIGKNTILMASDILESMGHVLTRGNNFSISVSAESEKEADKIFSGLSAGGKVTMPLEKAFWGSYFGMLTDKFGVQWMVSYDYNQPK
jgi:PhnB protein